VSKIRVRYQTIEIGDRDIHLRTLKDKQQYSDDDNIAEKKGISSANWSLFGVVWDSGKVLANLMNSYETEGLRILEVGCGIGLASLVLNQRSMNITATDYHPEAEKFLEKNVKLNEGKDIPFVCTGWGDADSELGKFDLIIGSDILYERTHVALLSDFIEEHAANTCDVILVDPGRGHHAKFSKTMVALGYSHSQQKTEKADYLAENYRGQVLYYRREIQL
jgi:predicted nicotinamide N-methyase